MAAQTVDIVYWVQNKEKKYYLHIFLKVNKTNISESTQKQNYNYNLNIHIN